MSSSDSFVQLHNHTHYSLLDGASKIPDLVARTDGWGLTRGLIPEPGSPAMPMEALRDRFMRNFSGSLDVPPA